MSFDNLIWMRVVEAGVPDTSACQFISNTDLCFMKELGSLSLKMILKIQTIT